MSSMDQDINSCGGLDFNYGILAQVAILMEKMMIYDDQPCQLLGIPGVTQGYPQVGADSAFVIVF